MLRTPNHNQQQVSPDMIPGNMSGEMSKIAPVTMEALSLSR